MKMEIQGYEEGYADGLAGAGAQDRNPADVYFIGFRAGSLDRKAMLKREAAK